VWRGKLKQQKLHLPAVAVGQLLQQGEGSG